MAASIILIRRAAATRVVSLFYLTPPVTALMAWAMFGERLAPLALVGMAVCVAGVFLVNWRPRGAAVRIGAIQAGTIKFRLIRTGAK